MIAIYNNGTKVKTTIGGIDALITGASISGKNVTYEISYFKDGEHFCEWVHEVELTSEELKIK